MRDAEQARGQPPHVDLRETTRVDACAGPEDARAIQRLQGTGFDEISIATTNQAAVGISC